jgi:hypothetical protein
MRKNVASQIIGAQMNSRTDGSPLTSAVSISVVGDNGAAAAGGGTLAHKGDGYWSYVPTQAETNYVHVAFTFTHASGVNQTVQAYPVAYNYGDAVRLGITALPNAAADAAGGLPISDAGGLDLDARLDAAVSTRATPAQVATELGTYDAPTRAELTTDINSVLGRLPAALVGGRIAAIAEVLGVDAVDNAALAANAVTEIVAGVFARAFSAAYGSLTFDEIMKVLIATQAAKLSGAATATIAIRNLDDSADVVVASVDASGNRTAVTVTP